MVYKKICVYCSLYYCVDHDLPSDYIFVRRSMVNFNFCCNLKYHTRVQDAVTLGKSVKHTNHYYCQPTDKFMTSISLLHNEMGGACGVYG